MCNLLRLVCLTALGELLFAAPSFGQTFEVKDQNGSVVLTITTVKMFRQSEKENLPAFQDVVKNVSGQSLTLEALKGTVRKKDGSTVEFVLALCDVRWCEFPKNSERDVNYLFDKGSFTPATFDSVTFSWQTESERIAAWNPVAEAILEQLKASHERARSVVQQVIGRSVYAVAYSHLYKLGTPVDIMAEGATLNSKAEEVRITDFPRLVPLQIVSADMTSEGGGGVIFRLHMPNSQEAIAFMENLGGEVMSDGAKFFKAIGSYGNFFTGIPKFTPREMAAIRKESIFRGMSRRALECAIGYPESENDWGTAGIQLVYFGSSEYVYLRQGAVVDWQLFDIK